MVSFSIPKIKNICVFLWIQQSWERKSFRISKSSWSGTSWEKDSFSVWGRQPWANGACVNSCIFRRQSSFRGPQSFSWRGHHWKTAGEELQVSTMSEKLSIMFNHVDVFIAWPGGLGTLEEIFHISSWAQLNIHQKPIGLLNVNGFYNILLSFLDHVVEQ